MLEQEGPAFVMFSTAHQIVIVGLVLLIVLLFAFKNRWTLQPRKAQQIERLFALSLLGMDIAFYIWLFQTGRWNLSSSLPLELCSISLVLTIVLLWTGNKHVYDFVFYAGIGGALQAIATPVLDLSFPHFRYFHFFFTHAGIVLVALYFTWVKGCRPTFKGILKTMLALNVLLPLVFVINVLVNGNYMFLRTKPVNGSLLDYLGPYPWYIVSLELVAFFIFVCLWLVFRKRRSG
ncbi:TIGR02206 family membrane protein [Paenisporosarcina sp. FSL H8-0542]|uniref:YwaF family protein n=1 Tax=Paenisporosarcina sp. FSL H8-0542 TaxID=2921401 RepID=UPI00315A3A42